MSNIFYHERHLKCNEAMQVLACYYDRVKDAQVGKQCNMHTEQSYFLNFEFK